MISFRRMAIFLFILFFVLLPHVGLLAAEKGKPEPLGSTSVRPELPPAPIKTRHSIEIEGRKLSYTAEAGSLPLKDGSSKIRGEVFFVAYTADRDDKKKRPLAFVFNGGPGAASAYLHLGALGPKRIVFNEDGTPLPPPARMTENHFSWLGFTDLVFIDPIGTGFSRTAHDPKKDQEKKKKASKDLEFWTTKEDLKSLAEFIRLYLTRNDRWLSPKFLVGESYGGFRVAALSEMLATDFGIGLNGLVLISPVLEFSLFRADNYRPLPWALLLPSYAATAISHGKSSIKASTEAEMTKALSKVETFSLNEYLINLVQGHELSESENTAFFQNLSHFTGLPTELLKRLKGRVPRYVFAKELLRDSQRLVGMYDGSISGIDPYPESPISKGHDPTLEGLTDSFTTAFNGYIRDELKFKTDRPYLLLNREVNRRWRWTPDSKKTQGFIGTADRLKEAMSLNRKLKVMITHGYFDLVTPYFGSKYTVRQMGLDKRIRKNMVFKVYEGGHMIYTKEASRQKLFRDVKEFFLDALR